MARKARDKFLDAIQESYRVLLSVIDASEERGHKVSRSMLAEARKGERDAMDLTRKWVDTPANLFENIEAAITVQADAERRALELARDALTAGDEYRQEVRQALARLVRTNRVAGEALVEEMRAAPAGTLERVRRARPGVRADGRTPAARSGQARARRPRQPVA